VFEKGYPSYEAVNKTKGVTDKEMEERLRKAGL